MLAELGRLIYVKLFPYYRQNQPVLFLGFRNRSARANNFGSLFFFFNTFNFFGAKSIASHL